MLLTPEQRQALANLLTTVFLRQRSRSCWPKKADLNDVDKMLAALERYAAIGDAFHNLPLYMLTDEFDFKYQILSLECHLDRVPELQEFIIRLKEIEKMSHDGVRTH